MSKRVKLSKSEFESLIELSKMYLKDSEKERIRGMLSEALDAIQVLNELDTKNVPTLDHPTGDLVNVTRKDVVKPSLTQSEALSNAKETHNGYFVVPAILESSGNV